MYVCDRARVSPFASSTSRPPKIRHDEVFRSVSFRCSVPFPVSFPFFPFCSLVKQVREEDDEEEEEEEEDWFVFRGVPFCSNTHHPNRPTAPTTPHHLLECQTWIKRRIHTENATPAATGPQPARGSRW